MTTSRLFPSKIKWLEWNNNRRIYRLNFLLKLIRKFSQNSWPWLAVSVKSTSCQKSSFFNPLCSFTDEPQTTFLIFWSTSLFSLSKWLDGYQFNNNPCIQSKQKTDIALRTGTIGNLVGILMLLLHLRISRMKSNSLHFMLLQHFST